jgi:hypothetical protein
MDRACGYFDDSHRLLFTWAASGSYPAAWVSGNHFLGLAVSFFFPDSVPVTAERLDSALAATPVTATERAGEPPLWGTQYPLEARLSRESDRVRLVVRARPLVEAFLRTRSDSVRLSWCAGQRHAVEQRVSLIRR